MPGTIYFIAVVPTEIWAAIIGAVVEGGVLALVLGWYFARKSDLATLVERTCDTLDLLSKDCGKYWLCLVPEELEIKKRLLLEAKIKAGVLQVNTSVVHMAVKYKKPRTDEIKIKILKLQTACTSETFEAASRGRDPARYMEIVRLIHDLQCALYALKL